MNGIGIAEGLQVRGEIAYGVVWWGVGEREGTKWIIEEIYGIIWDCIDDDGENVGKNYGI